MTMNSGSYFSGVLPGPLSAMKFETKQAVQLLMQATDHAPTEQYMQPFEQQHTVHSMLYGPDLAWS